MKKKVTPKTLSGFMELLPAEQLVFNRMKEIIREEYEAAGFVPMDTPVLEYAEILLAKAGGETEKQIYRFNKGEADLCMRFDLTVPLSRFVAQHQNGISFPFRRYQISKVYRGERPQKGRFREFYQADIDIVGSEKLSLLYDAEIPSVMYHIFKKMGLKRFHIHLNNRKILNGFYQALGLEEKAGDILRIIDKMPKIGRENVQSCLTDLDVPSEKQKKILSFVETEGSVDEMICQLRQLPIENDLFKTGVSEMETVCQTLKELGVPQTHIAIDLKITRGLDYYTGTVYETYADDFPNWGAICSGGRYDNLAENYTDRRLPGIGMSIGLTRFFDLLRDAGLLNIGAATSADVLMLPMGASTAYILGEAAKMREKGLRVELFLAETKFKNKMTYANKIGVPFVAIIGENEEAEQKLSLKNMSSGEQKLLSTNEATQILLETHVLRKKEPVIRFD